MRKWPATATRRRTRPSANARTDEYLTVLRQEWTAAAPFDHQGKYYDIRQAFSAIKPDNLRSSSAARRTKRSKSPAAMPMSMRSGARRSIRCATLSAPSAVPPRVTVAIPASRSRCAPCSATPRKPPGSAPMISRRKSARSASRPGSPSRAIARPMPARCGSSRPRRAIAATTRLWTGVAALTGAAGNSTGARRHARAGRRCDARLL